MKKIERQAGFTFTEIALGLALFVLVSVSGFAAFQALSDRNKVNDTIKEFGAIFSAAEDWKAGKANFTGIDMDTLNTQGLVPTGIGGGVGTNPWGGNYTVGPKTGDTAHVTITATNVDAKPCANIADKLLPDSQGGSNSTCASGVVTVSY